MAQLISFYTPVASQGKRTISMAFAYLLAKNNYKTLYVELDVENPSVELATKISHDDKNILEYFKAAQESEQFHPQRYILTHKDLVELNKRDYQHYPEELDFLTLPRDFDDTKFPIVVDGNSDTAEQVAYQFIQKFTYELESSHYDYVILSLPNQIQHLFSYEVIRNSHQVVNLLTPSPTNISKNLEVMKFLKQSLELEEKLHTIVNMASLNIDASLYKSLLGVKKNLVVIPFDLERQENEFALKIESPFIAQHLEQVAANLGILLSVTLSTKPKKFFSTAR